MYDSVDVATVPDNPQAVAGYVGGHWPTYNALVAKFPHAHHLSIAVFANERARCLDVEPGDAVNGQAPGWFNSLADHSQGKPVLYTSASNVQALINTMSANGIARDRYFIWSAHYSFQEHICSPGGCGYPQADLTQWSDHALGRNLDVSLVSDAVFGAPPKPKPPVDPNHYDWFYTGPFDWGKYHNLNERQIVQQYDGARKHPVKYAVYLKFDLEPKLKALADRVADQAIKENPLPDGSPDWNAYHRGWRFQQLVHRSQGQQLVK